LPRHPAVPVPGSESLRPVPPVPRTYKNLLSKRLGLEFRLLFAYIVSVRWVHRALGYTTREAFWDGGGLPPEAREEREIGAPLREPEEGVVAGKNREIGAELRLRRDPMPQGGAPEEPCCARFIGPADGLGWEMGIRPGVAPLLAYRSGDRVISPRWGREIDS